MKRWIRLLSMSLVAACACAAPAPRGEAPMTNDVRSAPGAENRALGAAAAAPAAGSGKYGEVPGENLVPDGGVRAFGLQGEASAVTISVVPVTGQPFAEALRAEVKARPKNPWDLQVRTTNAKAIEAGDVLLATFYLRTERSRQESNEGETEFVLELGREPWTKSATYSARASRDWKKFHVPFVAAASHAAGDAQMAFRLGYDPQTIEIGGVTVENFGKKLALAELPVTRIVYAGMEPDAAWRRAAEERIEKIRKADLRVAVTDAKGKPVAGAEVRAVLVRHAFGFGTCLPAETIVSGEPRFRELTLELFNTVTLENDLKWVALAGDWGPGFKLERAQAAVDWLRANQLDVRGHVMVWPGWRNLPKFLKAHEKDPKRLRELVKQRVREIGAAMKGKLVHWDVLNEPFDNHDLMDLLGDEVMVEWFREARAIDPAAKLFINDYAILAGGGGTTPHRDHYEKTIRYLIEKGAPLDAIGLQGHFGSSLTGPVDLFALLDRYAKFKKPIYITEYDVVIDDEETAGRFTRDFYTTLFSHPAVAGIVMWGFWDGSHWKKNAAMYRKDWTLKPGGQAYRDLVLGAWRTNATGTTGADGSFGLRGFLGDYDVTVSAGGKQQTQRVKLGPGGAKSSVKLP